MGHIHLFSYTRYFLRSKDEQKPEIGRNRFVQRHRCLCGRGKALGDLSWAPVGYGVLEFRAFFDFAVPFFLATSFYLAAQKLDRTGSLYSLGSRFKRLLVPYLFWSLIYICFKAAFFLFNNDTTSFHKLFSDPIGIVFLGASSVQLYFLPWLFVGTCWMMFSKKMLDRKFRIRIQAIFFY
jgi:fucose 4-O-acetylase-like acetyltransferase